MTTSGPGDVLGPAGGGPGSDQDPRLEVAQGCQILGREGQSDFIWGHVSSRGPAPEQAWLKGAGLGFDEIGADEIMLIGRDGSLLSGQGRVHFEYPIHTEVLAARPDVGAVVHTHAEAAVAFGATGMELRPIGHEGTLFTPPALVRYTDTADLIRTPEMGSSVAEALGDRNAMLLVNHGIVTVGPDVATAVLTAVFLEKACRMQLLAAAAAGGDLTWSSDEEALGKRGRVYGPHQMGAAWQYVLRRLQRATR